MVDAWEPSYQMLPERATGPISTSHYGWDTLAFTNSELKSKHYMQVIRGDLETVYAHVFCQRKTQPSDCATISRHAV